MRPTTCNLWARTATKGGRGGSWLLTIPGPLHLCHGREMGNRLIWNRNLGGKPLKSWVWFSYYLLSHMRNGGAGRARNSGARLSSSWSGCPGVWHCKSVLPLLLEATVCLSVPTPGPPEVNRGRKRASNFLLKETKCLWQEMEWPQ